MDVEIDRFLISPFHHAQYTAELVCIRITTGQENLFLAMPTAPLNL
jgi:hypothetical protein